MQLKQGTLLQGGKYKVEELLGQGGFGITYLASHTMLGSKVAIKEFYFKDCCERALDGTEVSVPTKSNINIVERFKSKFIKEAQTVFQMKHDNIVRIFDIFEENNTAYYVMEYIENGSLHDVIKKEGTLDEARVLKYSRQIADALGYIHNRNVLHLDIKPANILLRSDDNIVIIDFGVSKRYDETGGQTSTTPAGISKGYAPLEQYKQGGLQSFVPCTDIYSLGATMFKMLTGTTPPEASDIAEDGLPQMSNKISIETRKAIIEAMKPRRKDRPQSATAFMGILPKTDTQSIINSKDSNDEVFDDEETIVDTFSHNTEYSDETYLDEEDDEGNKKKIIIAIIVFLAIVACWFIFGGNKTDVNTDTSDSILVEDSILTSDNDDIYHEEETSNTSFNDKKKSEKELLAPENQSAQDQEYQEVQTTSNNSVQTPTKTNDYDGKVFDVVEQMPSFPGGQAGLMQFLSSHVMYPTVAEENGIQGRVTVQFVVERDGRITEVKTMKSVDPSLDKEAERVVRSMPKWIPGKQNGSAVRVKYFVPVTFRLQ